MSDGDGDGEAAAEGEGGGGGDGEEGAGDCTWSRGSSLLCPLWRGEEEARGRNADGGKDKGGG